MKPGNVWLEGERGKVKLLDFGLARAVDGPDEAKITWSGGVVGTPAYMAPEQAAGAAVDARADLFSLGAVLYELAAGRRAFVGDSVFAVLTALARDTPKPVREANPLVPEPLADLITGLLVKEPAKRAPATAADLASALRSLEAGTPRGREVPPAAARRGRKLALAAVVAGLVFGGIWLVLREKWTTLGAPLDPHGDSGAVAMTAQLEPLRVKSLDIKHFHNTAEGDVPKGILGQKSFSPRLGDRVQVVANLSRPGYAYIIAFRPDGVADLCFPEHEDQAPHTPTRPPATATWRATCKPEGRWPRPGRTSRRPWRSNSRRSARPTSTRPLATTTWR